MILVEHNGKPPAGGADLREPGPVWYTPHPRSVHAHGGPLPARLVRSLDDKAWIALWQPDGRWKRLQARNARLAPRQEVLEMDRAWAALGKNGGAVTSDARGAVIRTPTSVQPSSTSPRAGLIIAAEPGPAAVPSPVSGKVAELRCPNCGTGSASGRKFRHEGDLLRHTHWCTLVLRGGSAVTPAPAAAAVPSGETPLHCPHCGVTGARTGGHFRSKRDLLFHVQWCARRLHAEAADPSPASTDRPPLRCPDCGTTRTRAGNRFINESDLLRHRRWHQKRAYFARAPLPPLVPNETIDLGRTGLMHPPDFAPAAPLDSAAAEPLQCPNCGATGGKRGAKFRDPRDLAQHRQSSALRATKAASEAHRNGSAPAATAAQHNGSGAQPSPGQDTRFCTGCGLNLEDFHMHVRFCPACGRGTTVSTTDLSQA